MCSSGHGLLQGSLLRLPLQRGKALRSVRLQQLAQGGGHIRDPFACCFQRLDIHFCRHQRWVRCCLQAPGCLPQFLVTWLVLLLDAVRDRRC